MRYVKIIRTSYTCHFPGSDLITISNIWKNLSYILISQKLSFENKTLTELVNLLAELSFLGCVEDGSIDVEV